MENIFILASRKKFRFSSSKGELSVEQLWDLPLVSKTGFDLDTIAKTVSRELKGMEEESFVETRSNPRRGDLEAMMEVVKTVIATKQADNRTATEKAARDSLRSKLREAIETKKDRQLGEMSIEELEAQLAALS